MRNCILTFACAVFGFFSVAAFAVAYNVQVKNGTVSGCGNSGGISLGSGQVSSNNLSGDEIGITVAGQSVVTGNTVSATSTGLFLVTGSTGSPLVGTNIFNATTPVSGTVLSLHNNFCNNSSC